MDKKHTYTAIVKWTGNTGMGTKTYTSYQRDHEVFIDNKTLLNCSSDPKFRGDPTKHNPEDLLLISVSSCHMLWYLHLCTVNKITVTHYEDRPEGVMEENQDGSGQFKKIVLNPVVTIEEESKVERAIALHEEANKYCFIANSVNFPIFHDPKILAAQNLNQ